MFTKPISKRYSGEWFGAVIEASGYELRNILKREPDAGIYGNSYILVYVPEDKETFYGFALVPGTDAVEPEMQPRTWYLYADDKKSSETVADEINRLLAEFRDEAKRG